MRTQALVEMYPEFELYHKIGFQFKAANFEIKPTSIDDLKIQVVCENKVHILFCQLGCSSETSCVHQILRSEVDFWAMDLNLEDMKLRHREKMYPPKVRVIVHNNGPTSMATVTTKILKAEIDDINIILDFSTGMYNHQSACQV